MFGYVAGVKVTLESQSFSNLSPVMAHGISPEKLAEIGLEPEQVNGKASTVAYQLKCTLCTPLFINWLLKNQCFHSPQRVEFS